MATTVASNHRHCHDNSPVSSKRQYLAADEICAREKPEMWWSTPTVREGGHREAIRGERRHKSTQSCSRMPRASRHELIPYLCVADATSITTSPCQTAQPQHHRPVLGNRMYAAHVHRSLPNTPTQSVASAEQSLVRTAWWRRELVECIMRHALL